MTRVPRIAVVLVVVCLALLPGATFANGHSVTLYLSYLPEISNWGPPEATGQATVNVGEGTIALTASGLPILQGEVYEVWLVTAGMAQWVSLGRFSAQDDGSVAYAAAVDGVPLLEYRYLLLSVEPETADPLDPSGQIGIGSAFPNPDVALATPAAQATLDTANGEATGGAASAEATPAAPAYLPVTGGQARGTASGSVVAAAALTGLVATFALRRWRRV